MKKREVYIDLVLGTAVLSREGGKVGRIEEVRMGERQEILEFRTGTGALLERLSAMGLFRRKKKGYRVRWDQIDWSDVRHPRLTCEERELSKL